MTRHETLFGTALEELGPLRRFRLWMELNGWTQNRVAEEIGISDAHISYVMRGYRPMTPRVADGIARLTDGAIDLRDQVGQHLTDGPPASGTTDGEVREEGAA